MGEIEAAIRSVINTGAFAGGPFVAAFEKDFAAFCQCDHAVGSGSGTDALWLALLACGVGPGDEVITVPNTFMATAEAITYCGARPVFVDVDKQSYTLDPSKLKAAITKKTKAVIPVHLFGQPADMDPILSIARAHGLFVIEDACQAHGANYKGVRAGSLGDAGCFSFYPGKNLGAFGEAGAVTTNNAELASKMRILRDHGQSRKYHHTMIGWNCRMDGIQAAVLQIKLRHLERWNTERRSNAALYNKYLQDVEEVAAPEEQLYARHVYHIYAIRVSDRTEFIDTLTLAGIECGIHYPVPVHLQEAYSSLGYKSGAFPVAEKLALELVSLPIYPELSGLHIEKIALHVKKASQAGLLNLAAPDFSDALGMS